MTIIAIIAISMAFVIEEKRSVEREKKMIVFYNSELDKIMSELVDQYAKEDRRLRDECRKCEGNEKLLKIKLIEYRTHNRRYQALVKRQGKLRQERWKAEH